MLGIGKKKTPQANLALAVTPQDLLSDISTSEEALGKIMALLADETKRNMISDLAPDEVSTVAGLLAVADQYKIELLRKYLNYFMLLRISKNRKGRQEIIELGGARMQAQAGWRARLGGMLGREKWL